MPRWIPNFITALRIVLIPVFVLIALPTTEAALPGAAAEVSADVPMWARRIAALVVLLAIGGSDLLDGYLARRFELVSRVGIVLDAVADKLAQLSIGAFFTFVDPRLPIWYLGLLLVRDALLGFGTIRLHSLGPDFSFEHRYHGKLASSLIFILLMAVTLGLSATVVTPIILVSALAVVYSTADYVRHGHREWTRAKASLGPAGLHP